MFVMALDPHLKTKCIGGELGRLLEGDEDAAELCYKEGDAATEPHSTNGVSHHDGETTTTNIQPYFTATLILGQGRILDLRPILSTPLHGGSGDGGGDSNTTKRVAPPPPPQHIYCHHNSLLLMGPETMHQFQASFQNRKKKAHNVTLPTKLPGAKTVTKVTTTCPPQVSITFRKTRTSSTPSRPRPASTTAVTSTSTTPIRSNRVTFSKTRAEPVCRLEKRTNQALGMASTAASSTTTTTTTTALNAGSSKITNITINYVAGETAVHHRRPPVPAIVVGGGTNTFHRSLATNTMTTTNTDRGKAAATTSTTVQLYDGVAPTATIPHGTAVSVAVVVSKQFVTGRATPTLYI